MWKTLTNIWKASDIRSKLLWTVGLLVFTRFMAVIPIPTANLDNLSKIFDSNTFFRMLNLFSGGGLEKFSIIALGINPYITASIILQLLQVLVPQLEELAKEGNQGRQTIQRYTRYLMVPLAIVQAWGLIFTLNAGNNPVFPNITSLQTAIIIATLTAGSVFLMWLGELITEKGVGNGTSMIIFAGIVVDYPRYIINFQATFDSSQLIGTILLIAMIVLLVGSIVIMNEAERQIPVAYAKRVRGNKMYGGSTTFLPLKVNQAGVIPIIFASSLLLFPQMIATFFQNASSETVKGIASFITSNFGTTTVPYQVFFFLFVIGFTYFYSSIQFNPKDISENIQKQGGFIPGIRPGVSTIQYLSGVIHRLTFSGAIFLGCLAVFPFVVPRLVNFFAVVNTSALQLQGTGMLITVSVILETIRQMESMLLMRNYEGFMKKTGKTFA